MKYVLYNHVGSANHGCEALVRSIRKIFKDDEITLISEAPDEETMYGVNKIVEVKPALNSSAAIKERIYAYWQLKAKNNYFYMDALPYLKALSSLSKNDVLVSIGGDIYCYENYPKYILLHRFAKKHVEKTILLGCSIEPESLSDGELLDDLKSYDLITARESITFNALKKAGINNVIYCPDSAFTLDTKKIELPLTFQRDNTVGLNISPLVLRKSANSNLIMKNYRVLIHYLLKNTNKSIALVPHVKWKSNDDSEPLSELYNDFEDSERVLLLPDMDAERIKYCISCCSEFIGARTHSTIAAYSTGVPTIVLGYSVKSKGIARDLFGTEKHYVVPYQSITDETFLLNEYLWLKESRDDIRKILFKKVDGFIEEIRKLPQKIEESLMNKTHEQ